MSLPTLGFAGLGRMGGPLSRRLVDAGYQLFGFDAAGTDERLPSGAAAVDSIEDLARTSDVMLLSVPDGTVSRTICGQIADTANRRVGVIIDLSTIGIAAARACDETLRAVGVIYVDAPVSGGVAGAESGSLSMMVGATADVFTEIEPILDALAKNRFRIGDQPGQGQAMKLLNNYVSAAALAATCEAAVFAERLGLDLSNVVDVLNASSGRSAASQDKFPRSVIPRSYDFGFAGALMTKDVSLYLESASAVDVPHELASAVTGLWQRFNATHPSADFTYLHKYLEDGGA